MTSGGARRGIHYQRQCPPEAPSQEHVSVLRMKMRQSSAVVGHARGLAGETACPTKPPRRSSQNVAAARALAGPESLELPCLESRATLRGCSTANQQLTGQKLEVHGEKLQARASLGRIADGKTVGVTGPLFRFRARRHR